MAVLDPNEKDYPSKSFIKAAAYQQLLADITRQPKSLYIKREKGRDAGVIKFTPGQCEPGMEEDIDDLVFDDVALSKIAWMEQSGLYEETDIVTARKTEQGVIGMIVAAYKQQRAERKNSLADKLKSLLPS